MSFRQKFHHLRKRIDLVGKFSRLAKWTANKAGHPGAFMIAVGIIFIWALTGPIFNYSNTWQLIINTGTTIVTFLMLFLVQNTQNRDSTAIQVKLDELIRVTRGAHNWLMEIEDMSYEELDALRARYELLANRAKHDVERGRRDTGVPSMRSLEPRDEAMHRERARRGAAANRRAGKPSVAQGTTRTGKQAASVESLPLAGPPTNGALPLPEDIKPRRSSKPRKRSAVPERRPSRRKKEYAP